MNTVPSQADNPGSPPPPGPKITPLFTETIERLAAWYDGGLPRDPWAA